MHVAETHDPDVLRIDDSNFFGRLCGFAVILVAAAIWPVYLHLEEVPEEPSSGWGTVLLLVITLFAATCGIFLLLYESQTFVDRRLSKVVQWSRIFFWKPKKEYDLRDFSRTRISKIMGRHTQWSVEFSGYESDILLYLGPSHSEATQLAELLSEFTGLPISE